MSSQALDSRLDCHIASDSERAASFGNVYECWGDGRPVDEYVASRMVSVQHARASWWVGCIGTTVVASLGTYPIVLRVGGVSCPGFAVAAVYTRPEHRRRGHAATLMRWVERQQLAGGAQFGLLYSDINPDYYAAMGYRLCDSHYAWAVPDSNPQPRPLAGRFQEFDPSEQAGRLAEMYISVQSSRSVWIERDGEYWDWLRGRYPDHEWHWWLSEGSEVPTGYVQLKADASETRVLDWGVVGDGDERAFWENLVGWSAERGVSRIGGWLPASEAVSGCFEVERREIELTMLSPLTSESFWSDALVRDAGWFAECDHV